MEEHQEVLIAKIAQLDGTSAPGTRASGAGSGNMGKISAGSSLVGSGNVGSKRTGSTSSSGSGSATSRTDSQAYSSDGQTSPTHDGTPVDGMFLFKHEGDFYYPQYLYSITCQGSKLRKKITCPSEMLPKKIYLSAPISTFLTGKLRLFSTNRRLKGTFPVENPPTFVFPPLFLPFPERQ